jgi:hypothetical protein
MQISRSLPFLALLGLSCSPAKSPAPVTPWTPGTTYETARGLTSRGFLDRRGLVHAHSVYSHDACDGEPVDANGVRNAQCFEDFRRDFCTSKHDFVMLTDHGESFADTEFPETLLYRAERGDQLIQRDGQPVANWAACADGRKQLILGGTETATLAVGLEGHVGATPQERHDIYGKASAESLEAEKAKHGVALAMHTEDWTVEQLGTLPFDGFEMYNLHANVRFTPYGMNAAAQLLGRLLEGDKTLGNPNLVFLNFFYEDPRYLGKWGTLLSNNIKRVTTMGTDCHRNAFSQQMSDGDRVDSYRRMMIWFSNHLLVKAKADGSYDDRDLKDALRNGRLYGAFEAHGYPVGFDYIAESKGTVSEMGSEVALADSPVLKVAMPKVDNLDPKRTPPALTIRILRAINDGWEEMKTGTSDVAFTPTQAGAYRAEVRIVPNHLKEDLGGDAETLLAHDYVWIYSNPIYVR